MIQLEMRVTGKKEEHWPPLKRPRICLRVDSGIDSGLFTTPLEEQTRFVNRMGKSLFFAG